MTTVVERRAQGPDDLLFACDFSAPRGDDPVLLASAGGLTADFISVAYNPGRSVRVNSVLAAHWIRQNTGMEVLFTLSTRDINKVGLQSLLLGAGLVGLENVVVVKGDDFTERDLSMTKPVYDFKPTELLTSIASMNEGLDYRGLRLRAATDFCAGATIDLNRGAEREAALTRRKVKAGAQFFLMQPAPQPSQVSEFLEVYATQYGEALTTNVFVGVQVMAPEALFFGELPAWMSRDLDAGRPGHDIAIQSVGELVDAGFRSIYLIPAAFRGGRRDYDTAQEVLAEFKR